MRTSTKYKSDSIALYLIAIANDKKISVNITKIQELLYIVYGTFLRVYGMRLIDEQSTRMAIRPSVSDNWCMLMRWFRGISEDEMNQKLTEMSLSWLNDEDWPTKTKIWDDLSSR